MENLSKFVNVLQPKKIKASDQNCPFLYGWPPKCVSPLDIQFQQNSTTQKSAHLLILRADCYCNVVHSSMEPDLGVSQFSFDEMHTRVQMMCKFIEKWNDTNC